MCGPPGFARPPPASRHHSHATGRPRMCIGRSAVFLCCTLSAGPTGHAAGQTTSPGVSVVGFTRVTRPDSSRRTASGTPRAVEVAMWYPARATSRRSLTIWEYYRESAPKQLDEVLALLKSRGVTGAVVERWMSAPMLAASNAPVTRRRYPLVLLA